MNVILLVPGKEYHPVQTLSDVAGVFRVGKR